MVSLVRGSGHLSRLGITQTWEKVLPLPPLSWDRQGSPKFLITYGAASNKKKKTIKIKHSDGT